jgi:uncharacterized protein (DUF362 family)
MGTFFWQKGISRRGFLKGTIAGVCFSLLHPFNRIVKGANPVNPLYWVKDIPDYPFCSGGTGNDHVGVDALLLLMGDNGLKFYRSSQETALSGSSGMIATNDVVLIKVNAQWKYRGCTNSDLIRGLIQAILNHPDGFNGEVVIFENGQGRGSLNCDTSSAYLGDTSVHANANDENQSFLYLVNVIFSDSQVSAYLLDPIRSNFIDANDHGSQGYRRYENVSYPCFTTAKKGYRVELREGIWQDGGYTQNLKLINVPVLKHHDTGGSEITASLKHFYGVVSMADGQYAFRHFRALGETCGTMVVSVRTPVLNIIDATWISFSSIAGYPSQTTYRANQILASQDPVALDYWAAKYMLNPISNNPRHLPSFSGVDQWLTSARDTINGGSSLYNPNSGIMVDKVTKNEDEMQTHNLSLSPWIPIPGQTASTPSLAWNPVAQKMQIVVRGGGDTIWTGTFNSSGPFEAGSWVQILGSILSGPALAWNPIGQKMQIVVRGGGDSIWSGTFDSNGAFMNDWVQIPGAILSAPALAWNQAGNKMQMVVRGEGNTIWSTLLNADGSQDGSWAQIPGAILSGPALAWSQDYPGGARMLMVVQGGGNSIWAGTFNSSGVFEANSWVQIPGAILSAPALAWNPNYPGGARMQIAVRGEGGSIWSGALDSNGALNDDHGWTPISGVILSAPTLAWNEIAQKMQMVVRGRGDTMWSALANADGSF